MPKSSIFKDSSEVLAAGFPVLLNGLREVSGAIPAPAGPIVQGVLEATLFIMTKAEEFKTSKEDIYLLSAKSAQIVTVIVNEYHGQTGNSQLDESMLVGLKIILDEVSDWVAKQIESTDRRGRMLRFLKSDDTIKGVRRLNEKLDDAVIQFGLRSQVSAQKTLSAIQTSIEKTKDLIPAFNRKLEKIEMMQYLERHLPSTSKVETLSSNDSRCLGGTREGILNDISDWLRDAQHMSGASFPMIYWLTGVAGCGKSTISRSVVDMAKEMDITCSYFYFSRYFEDRRKTDGLMTTVAVDLVASGDTTLVQKIYRAIQGNHIYDTSPFSQQVDGLLKGPLIAASQPVVLVWDALDECSDSDSRQGLLNLLASLPELPLFTRIFLTSRHESDLDHARMYLGTYVRHRDITFDPHDDHDATPKDIERFVEHQMARGGNDWLSSQDLIRLTDLAGGMFMAAQFLCDFLCHPMGKSRLKSLSKNPNYGIGGSASSKLYHWYHTGLLHIFEGFDEQELKKAIDVIATILVVQYPLSRMALATLRSLDEEIVSVTLGCLSPFLITEGKKNMEHSGICFVHKSISDFLTSNQAGIFFINSISHSAYLALPCLQILCDQLPEAFRSLIGQNVQSSKTQVAQVSEILAYACQFWGYHLKDATDWESVAECVQDFVFSHLLEWICLMGQIDSLDSAIFSLNLLRNWKPISSHLQTLELVSDGIHYIQNFHHPLRTCKNMEYPWLYLSPTDTLLYQTYSIKSHTSSNILRGVSRQWSPLLTTISHTHTVNAVSVSPDGKYIVSGTDDMSVYIWDMLTGCQIGPPLKGHTGFVVAVAFSPDQKYVVSGARDKTVCIWDAYTGQPLRQLLSGHTNYVNSVLFSPDGRYIASGSEDCTICLWDAINGQLLKTSIGGHTLGIMSLSFSPDGKYIASGSADKTLVIWDTNTMKPFIPSLQGHIDSVNSVSFSPDGKYIVSGSNDSTVCIWNAFTGQQLKSPIEGHTAWVTSVAFSPDGKQIISGSEDNTICIWDAYTCQSLGAPLKGHTEWVSSIAFSPDGKHIISGSDDGTIRIWDAFISQLPRSLPEGHVDIVNSVAFSSDGKYMVSGSDDRMVYIWNALSGQPLGAPLVGHKGWVLSVAISPDGRHVISGSTDCTVHIWDTFTGQKVGQTFKKHVDHVTSVIYSMDGRYIASGSADQTVCIWDTATNQVTTLEGHTDCIRSVAFSSDGRLLVSGSDDKTLRIWDVITGYAVRSPLKGHTDCVRCVAFSPDGRRIVSGSDDKTICIWNSMTGQPLGSLQDMHAGPVRSVQFLPDGNHILSRSSTQTVMIGLSMQSLDHRSIEQGLQISILGMTGFTLLPDGWLTTLDKQQICWLPNHIQSTEVFWCPESNRIAICYPTGVIFIIKL